MANRVYYIGIRWNLETAPLQVDVVDRALGPLGDWIRINALTWLFSTSLSSKQVYDALHSSLPSADQILVIALDVNERFGWAPKWIWDWIDSQREDTPNTLAGLLANRSASREAS